MSTADYKIYLVNQSGDSQVFWAFLAKPNITNASEVFARSNTSLQISGDSTNINSFTLSDQYMIGASSSSNIVSLNAAIDSSATRLAELNQLWQVDYATVPPNQGPTIPDKSSNTSSAANIAMVTNSFNKATNEAYSWYSTMFFGVKAAAGLIGLSWSPDPQKTYTVTPNLIFYIAVGSYSNNSLVDINEISNNSAHCNTATDFDVKNQCTVIYTQVGGWEVAKGTPTLAALKK